MPTPTDAQLVQQITEAIQREQAEEPNRGSSADRDGVRGSFRTTLGARLIDAAPTLKRIDAHGVAHPDPTLKPKLLAYGTVIDASIGRLDALIIAHPTKKHGAQKFSPEAHAAGRKTFKTFGFIRSRIEARLSSEGMDKEIRDECGVGSTLTSENPQTVRDAARRMLIALKNPAFAERFKAREINAELLAGMIKLELDALEPAIFHDTGTTRGDNTVAIDKEAVFLDIAIERTLVVLEDGGAAEVADAIRELVPRKTFGRRAGDRQEAEEKDGKEKSDGAGGEAGDGAVETKKAPEEKDVAEEK